MPISEANQQQFQALPLALQTHESFDVEAALKLLLDPSISATALGGGRGTLQVSIQGYRAAKKNPKNITMATLRTIYNNAWKGMFQHVSTLSVKDVLPEDTYATLYRELPKDTIPVNRVKRALCCHAVTANHWAVLSGVNIDTIYGLRRGYRSFDNLTLHSLSRLASGIDGLESDTQAAVDQMELRSADQTIENHRND